MNTEAQRVTWRHGKGAELAASQLSPVDQAYHRALLQLPKLADKAMNDIYVRDLFHGHPAVKVLYTVPEAHMGVLIVIMQQPDMSYTHTQTIVTPMYGADEFPQCWDKQISAEQDKRDVIDAVRELAQTGSVNVKFYAKVI